MEQNVLWTAGGFSVMASRGQEIKSSYKGFSNLGGAELLERMRDGVQDAAKVTLELLESEPITPGEYDCICTPETTGMIVHEAFGHGVEMDMFVKKRALAEQFVGKQVASELVTMHDGASAAKEVATYFFDDEGVLAKDTVVIDRGILKAGISDAQSAMHLGTVPTGNGRRESYQRKAYTRMTNTSLQRHGGPQELGHPVHGQHRQGNPGREAHREDLLPRGAHRLCAGSPEIHQHGIGEGGAGRRRHVRQGLQGVGEGVRRWPLH